ncbi:MAG: UDP-2,3-diacylglucosamine diphosphatase [Woeseiaceae bacterium]|nr:UDP-2,3-diacylglucosamine diphosphatase [Woeseiaceae bacterium]
MPSAYFVSDIHIMSPECPRARAFVEFLRSLTRASASHLFLLGDIFDLWVADHRYFVDRYRDIVDEVRRLKDDGVEVHYFEGNHDLHLRYFWADQLGVSVHPGPIYSRLGETTARLEHGDQMDPDDKGYLFLRWFLRTAVIRFLIRHLPGRLIARIGDRASATSRHYTSTAKGIDAESAIGKIRTHAAKAHAEKPFDIIISGHVHVRDDWQADDGGFRSINLGSWFDRPNYFKLDEDEAGFHELAVNEDARTAQNLTEPAAAS